MSNTKIYFIYKHNINIFNNNHNYQFSSTFLEFFFSLCISFNFVAGNEERWMDLL